MSVIVKMQPQNAGQMGYATTQIGDMVAETIKKA